MDNIEFKETFDNAEYTTKQTAWVIESQDIEGSTIYYINDGTEKIRWSHHVLIQCLFYDTDAALASLRALEKNFSDTYITKNLCVSSISVNISVGENGKKRYVSTDTAYFNNSETAR